ncbi:hypothetical protein BK816_05735 [Boudabousia tangfeifanii]|uniref:UvrD-like helicase ATP-binding domain-containing protein n=1 Tax=Boudabousia tangfeifanii TaxID=1912795 RepID=A0A1D9MMW7_9ACTO|nr:hypothetical protein BK816_05735 [Boudabousia tangfeifanii]
MAEEQKAVDRAYQVLVATRKLYRRRQAEIAAAGAYGTHQARSERDAIANHFGDEAARLEQVEDRLVFGRLHYNDGTDRYIGRVGLQDEHNQRVLMDWRAPAAAAFYQATALHPQGVQWRRHLSTRLRKVIAVEDELLTANGSKTTNLQGEGALLAAMTAARSDHMRDIVATIQAEQDKVIRASSEGVLVVQGGPGTGKTAVALHRAAYLLYAEHKRLQKSGVLLLGPSQTFLRYIEKVLPSLGETGVVARTPATLLPGIKVTATDELAVAKLKGQIRWQDFIARAIRALVRPLPKTYTWRLGNYQAKLTPQMVQEAQKEARSTGEPHNQAWQTYAQSVMDQMWEEMRQADDGAEEKQWVLNDLRANLEIRRVINLCWLPCTNTSLISRLFADQKRLSHAAHTLKPAQIEQLLRPLHAPWTEADIPLLDEAAHLLGELPKQNQKQAGAQAAERLAHAESVLSAGFELSGIVSAEMLASRQQAQESESSVAMQAGRDRAWTYGHIVVDEAQELSPMMWRALLRRCPARSFTIVGDLDQQRIDHGARTWRKVLGPAAKFLQLEVVLETSYRTPASILKAAVEVFEATGRALAYPLKAVRDRKDALIVCPPTSKDSALELAVTQVHEALAALPSPDAGRVCLIVPETEINLPLWTQLLNEGDTRLQICTPQAAKGLEFDQVVLFDPHQILALSAGDLFVAMTRSTQQLRVIQVGIELEGLSAMTYTSPSAGAKEDQWLTN